MDSFVPSGFQVAGVHCGIKQRSGDHDLTLIVADQPVVAAGVYTQNRVFAAPVAWDRAITPSGDIRVVVANAGNANACTGARGLSDAREMARLAADTCGAKAEQALVLSTGVIGEPMPMDKIARGISAAASRLGRTEDAFQDAAQGILTTDRCRKVTTRQFAADGHSLHLAGMAKGAGMIGPRMATMLGVFLTDAALSPAAAQQILQNAVDDSFNCISVEGHMSTNDTVLLLASGSAGGTPLDGEAADLFQSTLTDACIELARAIPADGEGATHLITIDVAGCVHRQQADRIARAVANSALVKTAIAGADPNWGRIVSAAGYAEVPFDPQGVELRVNQTLLYQRGEPVPFDAEAVSSSIRDNPETRLELRFSEGTAHARHWTSDLTVDYVRLNAEYHT